MTDNNNRPSKKMQTIANMYLEIVNNFTNTYASIVQLITINTLSLILTHYVLIFILNTNIQIILMIYGIYLLSIIYLIGVSIVSFGCRTYNSMSAQKLEHTLMNNSSNWIKFPSIAILFLNLLLWISEKTIIVNKYCLRVAYYTSFIIYAICCIILPNTVIPLLPVVLNVIDLHANL